MVERSSRHAFVQGLVENRDGPVDLVTADGQGRCDPEYAAHRPPSDVEACPQFEAALTDCGSDLRSWHLGPAVGHHLDANQQAAPANITDDRVTLLKAPCRAVAFLLS